MEKAMGTIPSHPSLLAISNETSFNDLNSSNEDFAQLVILVLVWMVLIITIVFGTTGNLLVLYVYVNRNDHKTCTFFIKMLAIVDLFICLGLAPIELYQTTTGIRNEYLCKVYGFLNSHVLYSTFLITTIAFDRYFCICWPLYRILTINRGRIIVIICGFLSSLFAIIPMSEYSTMEHILHIHYNHSEHFHAENHNEYDAPIYTHVERIESSALILPYTIGNLTNVKCSPKFSFHIQVSKFLIIYRFFYNALFAICIVLVIILYSLIYKAIYQRRRSRTKKFSTYRRILRSYIISDETNRKSLEQNPFIRLFCCCHRCRTREQNSSHPSVSYQQDQSKPSGVIKQKPERIVLEVNGGFGKRFSAISMTSMTYLTSGVWDDPSSTNLIRSRINSTAAVSYCGMEHSLASRPSTSTEDSSSSHTQSRPTLTFKHLTVPNPSTVFSNDLNEIELLGNLSQTTNSLHRSIVRKPSRQQRLSEIPMHQRKVSFMTPAGIVDRCILEDPASANQPEETNATQQVAVHVDHQRLLSTSSSVMTSRSSLIRNSGFSARRPSVFDCETQRVFERQQRQEHRANIRTTLTLFIVTTTFILMYLPSIIITLFNIKPTEYREALFLLYYINSACNPLIYSFFNVNFRNDVRRIYECQKREYLARH